MIRDSTSEKIQQINTTYLFFLQHVYNTNTSQARTISYNTKIKQRHNTFIQHAYNTKFIQHKIYNIKLEFWTRVQRNCGIPRVKVKKGTTKIRETLSLIRHMYILKYIVIRTKKYILINA